MGKVIKNSKLAKILREEKMHKFAISNIIDYGTYVIENRALPDFRDGLKPVQRRILWAMHQAGFTNNGPYVKSARTTGEVMGKYHPHSDCYPSMVNLINMPISVLASQGNFGYFNTAPAASRYSEAKLASYSEKVLLDKSYLNVTDYMPSYTGEFKEPLVLPALLPHLLFNGASGIAVGVIVGIPPFEVKGVINLIKKGLKEKVSLKDCNKHLRVSYPHPYSSEILTPINEIEEFYKTGTGRLTLGVGYEVNGNQMIVNRFPPNFSMISAIEKLTSVDEVFSAVDLSGKAKGNEKAKSRKLVITLKASIPVQGRSQIFKKCADKLKESQNLRINLIERLDEDKVQFSYCNMPDFINKWISWRTQLEVKRHLYDVEQISKVIANLELQVMACENLDKIIPIIKSNKPDVEDRLQKVLRISLEDAKYILGLTLRRLTGLSLIELKEKIKYEEKSRKQSIFFSKNPADKMLADIDNLAKGIV